MWRIASLRLIRKTQFFHIISYFLKLSFEIKILIYPNDHNLLLSNLLSSPTRCFAVDPGLHIVDLHYRHLGDGVPAQAGRLGCPGRLHVLRHTSGGTLMIHC